MSTYVYIYVYIYVYMYISYISRTLNKVAMAHPMAVTPCNMDMEGTQKT